MRASEGLAIICCLSLAAILAPLNGAQAAGIERPAPLSSVSVAMGSTETVRSRTSYVDLVVGDPEIADAMPLTDRSFYVHGKKLGTTSVSVYDADKSLVASYEVEVGYNVGRLKRELRQRLPDARVDASSVNGRIFLSGSVPDAIVMDKALTIARQFGSEVVNGLNISLPQQVMLEVRFIEVSRNAGKALGIQWDVASRSIGFTTGPAMAATTSTPFASFLGKILSGGTKADALVQALEEKGLARRLAEPNLVAMSGQPASFLAGGEFPFPIAGDYGRVSVEFKKFGVGLTFTPTVLSGRQINLKIEPEVSQIDTTTAVQTSAGPVPSLVVRRASTNVELRDGQSFAIAGLLQSTLSDNGRQLPWLGDVPVLGQLFRSAAFEKHETELAIIVTPHLVKPAPAGQHLATPLDRTLPANDIDRFLGGQQEVPRGMPARVQKGGHLLDLAKGGSDAQMR